MKLVAVLIALLVSGYFMSAIVADSPIVVAPSEGSYAYATEQPGTTAQPQLEPRLAALEQRVAALEARPAPLPSKRQRDETRAQMKSFCAQRGLAFDSLEVGPRGEAVLVRCR